MHRLLALADLDQLTPRTVTVAGTEVLLVRVHDEVYALQPTCSHRGAPLVDGAATWKGRLMCPWHLATFDLRSGAATTAPAETPLRTFKVRVVDADVWLDTEGDADG